MRAHSAKPFFLLFLALLAALPPALALGQVTPVTAEEVVSTDETEPSFFPALAATPDGGFLVAWRAGHTVINGILVRRLDASGDPQSGAVQVNETPVSGQLAGPGLAVSSGGVGLVAWQGAAPTVGADFAPLLARGLEASGAPRGPEIEIAPHGRGLDVAALADGNFVVVWEDAPPDISRIEVLARLFSDDGAPLGPAFPVARRRGYSYQGRPRVAASPDGGFVVVWERGQRRPEIVSRLFDDAGAPAGDEFRIDTRLRVKQPDVAFAPDGGFTVVWLRGNVVYGQRFDPAGNPRRAPFPIAATREDRLQPVIAFDSAGNSVVAWNRSRQPTAVAQLFDAAGRFAGGHFLFTKNMMDFPAGIQVAFLAGGRLAAVWSGRDLPFLGGPLQILERLFELDLP
ncbi:MAG: hypothetical protein ACJ75H_14410 [Thermoanaerobaculia bacterium]